MCGLVIGAGGEVSAVLIERSAVELTMPPDPSPTASRQSISVEDLFTNRELSSQRRRRVCASEWCDG